ncbi:NAD-dependent epimerase/dehydratase family protein, partial [Vibrio parahaemolyticus]|uniref:NAD-dependent epimerase/dehydratase family protein n=1 Tax=Vibrio parahaemolyticus TaxID=670 RepID=UPI00112313BF
MKILVTGAKGFIGKNLCTMLREQGYSDIIEIDRETSRDELVESLKIADFVYHLAGVNRPKDDKEFLSGNSDLTSFIAQELKNLGKKVPIMVSSSIQVDRDNPYGSSKRLAEQAVEQYGEETGAPFFIYRFPNVFGKWCRPNYNSFVATFCHNTLNDLNITIHDPSAPVKLVYIDDVCAALIMLLEKKDISGFKQISPEYQTTVGDVAELLQS